MLKIDLPEFRLALERAMRSRVKAPVDVSLETGLYPQQLYAARNRTPHIDTYMTLCDWIGVDPRKFARPVKVQQKRATIAAAKVMPWP